jgi:hypothetical protein
MLANPANQIPNFSSYSNRSTPTSANSITLNANQLPPLGSSYQILNRLLTLTPESNRGRQSHDKPNGVVYFLSAQVLSIKKRIGTRVRAQIRNAQLLYQQDTYLKKCMVSVDSLQNNKYCTIHKYQSIKNKTS